MTAATSAGSSPFFCDCWRMMSSCLRGSVISSTACLSGCSPITTTSPTIASSARNTRLRRRRTAARRAAGGAARRRDVALAVAILIQLRKQFRQLDLQLFNRPVVAHDVVRFLGLFVLTQLPRRPRLDQLVPARGSAPGADVLVGDDSDGLVEHGFHP